jgi:hypothetical protein
MSCLCILGLAGVSLTGGCSAPGGNPGDTLRVSFDGYRSGSFVCRQAGPGTWAVEFRADDLEPVMMEHVPVPHALPDVYRTFVSAMRRAAQAVPADELPAHHMRVELQQGGRLAGLQLAGLERIERVFRDEPVLESLYTNVVRPQPLPKAYWFRRLVVYPDDIAHGEYQSFRPGIAFHFVGCSGAWLSCTEVNSGTWNATLSTDTCGAESQKSTGIGAPAHNVQALFDALQRAIADAPESLDFGDDPSYCLVVLLDLGDVHQKAEVCGRARIEQVIHACPPLQQLLADVGRELQFADAPWYTRLMLGVPPSP